MSCQNSPRWAVPGEPAEDEFRTTVDYPRVNIKMWRTHSFPGKVIYKMVCLPHLCQFFSRRLDPRFLGTRSPYNIYIHLGTAQFTPCGSVGYVLKAFNLTEKKTWGDATTNLQQNLLNSPIYGGINWILLGCFTQFRTHASACAGASWHHAPHWMTTLFGYASCSNASGIWLVIWPWINVIPYWGMPYGYALNWFLHPANYIYIYTQLQGTTLVYNYVCHLLG